MKPVTGKARWQGRRMFSKKINVDFEADSPKVAGSCCRALKINQAFPNTLSSWAQWGNASSHLYAAYNLPSIFTDITSAQPHGWQDMYNLSPHLILWETEAQRERAPPCASIWLESTLSTHWDFFRSGLSISSIEPPRVLVENTDFWTPLGSCQIEPVGQPLGDYF